MAGVIEISTQQIEADQRKDFVWMAEWSGTSCGRPEVAEINIGLKESQMELREASPVFGGAGAVCERAERHGLTT